MEQFTLALEPARARRRDPETSQVAAGSAREFSARHAAKIWCALRDEGPATIYELAQRTGLDHVQIARRLSEMQPWHAEPTGESRAGPSGRPCRVWRAK